MNSFATRDDTLAALERYPELPVDDLPLDFVQSKVPKLREDDLEPVEWPADPALEWAPPGHGDVYTSLATSGMLERLLELRLPLPVPVELGQPRRGARPAHPRLVRRARGCRSCRSRPTAPRPTARAATWRGGAPTAASCCARPRRRRTRTSTRSRTSSATASSTATTSGSTCGRCERHARRAATACSACR